MKRSTRFIVRVAASILALAAGLVISMIRAALGYDYWMCLAVTVAACWALLPSHDERQALTQALREDRHE